MDIIMYDNVKGTFRLVDVAILGDRNGKQKHVGEDKLCQNTHETS
jgi:hypothetical protein